MWWRQYTKELLGHRGDMALLTGALLLWAVFMLSRVGVWSREAVVVIYWFPIWFVPLWAIWTSVQLYRQEWRENTSYLMLSLPVRAWTITSAKLAVVATGVVGFSLLFLAGGIALAARTGFLADIANMDVAQWAPTGWLIKAGLWGYAWSVGAILVISLIAQFAYVFSRLFSRFQGIVMVWTLLLTTWLMGRVGDLGGRILAWLPDFHVQMYDPVGDVGGFHTIVIESGPLVALALFVFAVFALLNTTLERAVEV